VKSVILPRYFPLHFLSSTHYYARQRKAPCRRVHRSSSYHCQRADLQRSSSIRHPSLRHCMYPKLSFTQRMHFCVGSSSSSMLWISIIYTFLYLAPILHVFAQTPRSSVLPPNASSLTAHPPNGPKLFNCKWLTVPVSGH
jgi:hypothetical protein